jgi:hypothetical protein
MFEPSARQPSSVSLDGARLSSSATPQGCSPTRIVLPASAVAVPLASPSPAAFRTPGVPTDAAFYATSQR